MSDEEEVEKHLRELHILPKMDEEEDVTSGSIVNNFLGGFDADLEKQRRRYR